MSTLAWILATHSDPDLRNPPEAINLALRACEIANYQNPRFLDTLAAAYAAADRFEDAVPTAQKALKIIAATDNKELTQNIQDRLDLYKQKKPFRQP
jgi:tetratricopeptide (TPR) repeat protein